MIGNCYGSDTEQFYDEDRWADAAKYCVGCPVLMECRQDFADDPYAYAGGMRPAQRSKWFSRQPRQAAPKRGDSGLSQGRVTDEQRAEIVRLFDTEFIGSLEIANRVGVSKSTAQRILRIAGRRRTPEEVLRLAREGRRRAPSPASQTRPDGDATRAMVLKLFAENYKPKEVAELAGVCLSHVYRIKKEAA